MFAGTEGVVVPAEFAGRTVQRTGGPAALRSTLISQTSNALGTSSSAVMSGEEWRCPLWAPQMQQTNGGGLT